MPECEYPDCGSLYVRMRWVQARGETLVLCPAHTSWDGTAPEPTKADALATMRAAIHDAKGDGHE